MFGNVICIENVCSKSFFALLLLLPLPLLQSNICDTKFCGSAGFMQLLVIPSTHEREKKRRQKMGVCEREANISYLGNGRMEGGAGV